MSDEEALRQDAALSRTRLALWQKLQRSASVIEDELRRRLRRDCDSTLPRFDVMATLAQAPDGLKMSEISDRLRVSAGNVTGIVDKLAEEGLARRVAVPDDRRAARVQLTEKGQGAFAVLARIHESWINEMLGNLNADDVDGMILRLDRLVDALDTDAFGALTQSPSKDLS
ncbi:MAG: MarR family transcriptional regulator [Shimia sp.]|jgi:DNA-binding MarR family transcriptional regulator|uniref:MarR family transcriptional regulator n=1 Tax=Shimia sp. TaxID=1954381 RepID=UPI0040585CA5